MENELSPEEAQAQAAKLAEKNEAERIAKAEKEAEEKAKADAEAQAKATEAAKTKEVATKKSLGELTATLQSGKGLKPGEHFGFKNISRRDFHDRFTDTYWYSTESKSPFFDPALQLIPWIQWARLVLSGRVEVVKMRSSQGGVTFGVAPPAPAPTAAKAPKSPANLAKGKEGKKDEKGGKKDGSEDDADLQGVKLPEGFTLESLTPEQKTILIDPIFQTLDAEQQKSILESVVVPK